MAVFLCMDEPANPGGDWATSSTRAKYRALHPWLSADGTEGALTVSIRARRGTTRELLQTRQLALGGLRFFSTSASVIIIIIGSTGQS
jgi:hypothetical protein